MQPKPRQFGQSGSQSLRPAARRGVQIRAKGEQEFLFRLGNGFILRALHYLKKTGFYLFSGTLEPTHIPTHTRMN